MWTGNYYKVKHKVERSSKHKILNMYWPNSRYNVSTLFTIPSVTTIYHQTASFLRLLPVPHAVASQAVTSTADCHQYCRLSPVPQAVTSTTGCCQYYRLPPVLQDLASIASSPNTAGCCQHRRVSPADANTVSDIHDTDCCVTRSQKPQKKWVTGVSLSQHLLSAQNKTQ